VSLRTSTLIALLTVAGCDWSTTAHPSRSDGGAEDDAWNGTTPLFGACGDDRDCLKKLGAACLTTYPGGLCTFRCETDEDCMSGDALGRCVAHVCLPSCASSRTACARFGAGCIASETPGDGGDVCVPACLAASRVPPSGLACLPGTICDEHANTCFATPAAAGAENGAPCRADSDCLSDRCATQSDGYPDGYCVSYGVLPDKSQFVKGQPLPRSTCPAGSVVLPLHLADREAGQMVACFRGCTRDAECRPAYSCALMDFIGLTSGYCSPIDCASERPCPTGYKCVINDEGRGRCAR